MVGGVGGGVAGAGGFLYWRHKNKGEKLIGIPLALSAARNLSFSGAPAADTVYVLHPRKELCIPLANFHRVVFEDKVREAHDVFKAMGAKRVEIEVEEGYRRGFKFNLGLPGLGGGSGGAKQGAKKVFKKSSEFPGSDTPQLDPLEDPRFCWYPEETEWQDVYAARVNDGLKRTEVTLEYDDDFGVNASLAAEVQNANLSAGGEFEKFERTSWHWKVTFPDAD